MRKREEKKRAKKRERQRQREIEMRKGERVIWERRERKRGEREREKDRREPSYNLRRVDILGLGVFPREQALLLSSNTLCIRKEGEGFSILLVRIERKKN